MPEIKYVIGALARGPIEPSDYKMKEDTVRVSYEPCVDIGMTGPVLLPPSIGTIFTVTWEDIDGRYSKDLRTDSFVRFEPVQRALKAINKLLASFKLVRVGHRDGTRVNTIGMSDVLFYQCRIDDQPIGITYNSLYMGADEYPWRAEANDRYGTTALATKQMQNSSFAIARRFLRCFELIGHGYFSEAVIVCHAILDDVVQTLVSSELSRKGLNDKQSRDLVLRGVKDQRLKTFVGPVMQLLVGRQLADIWPDSDNAIESLNRIRNNIAHNGEAATQDQAHHCLLASVKAVAALSHAGHIDAKFPRGMYRQARLLAAWTRSRPAWVSEVFEEDEFADVEVD